jgi:acetyltransferase-like isoleucine patch superfamily enzyme
MRDVQIHASAIVETDRIGPRTRVWAFAHVLAGAVIGTDCNIGSHTFVESGAIIGNGVTIKNNNSIWSGITIDDGAFIGPAVVFTNDRHPRSRGLPEAAQRYERDDWLLPTRVGRGSTVGAGAIVLPGRTIGPYATVAAGAVVTRDVPAYTLVAGQPARPRGWMCCCGLPLRSAADDAVCRGCGLAYTRGGDGIRRLDTRGAAG